MARGRYSFTLLLIVVLSLVSLAVPQPARVRAAGVGPERQVDVRPSQGGATFDTAAIVWFGRATEHDNYADVRITYDNANLYVNATVVDYYLWYDQAGAADPRAYDAFGLYLDTDGQRLALPSGDDYFFVSGFRHFPNTSDARWQRQGRGTGTGWNEGWRPTTPWTDQEGGRWYSSGPNSNSDRDAGWGTTLTIPWATLGLAGPPASGATWAIGMQVFDRDDASTPATTAAWPETFSASAPTSWAKLAFNPTVPAPSTGTSTVRIRRGLNGQVSDAYAGGGGTCAGGIYGGGDQPHPTGDLFVQNQSDVADFPCFSKTYLSFDLGAVPPGKVIKSAALEVYQFGGSDPTQAQPSYIQLLATTDDWLESTLTWNNAPLASRNYGGTWVNPIQSFPGWPGVKATWNATSPVAEAYAAGRPASLVLYSADSAYHSGKYFVGSEVGDWDANGRPTLVVTYSDSTGQSTSTPTATSTATSTRVSTATATPTQATTSTATPTRTPSSTATPIATRTSTATATPTQIPTSTATATPTGTPGLPGSPTTATYQVGAGTNDVNEDGGSFDASASSLWLGNGASSTSSYAGLRFTGVGVPRGATIRSAYLEVYSIQTAWIRLSIGIGAEASGNSPQFSSTSRPSQRLLGAASVTHSSDVQWLANTWYRLGDVSSVIQEVVSRSDWQAGNSLSLILKGGGSSWARKFVASFERSPVNAPRLVVSY